MSKFRSFVQQEIEDLLDEDVVPYFAEMALGHRLPRDTSTVVPPQVMNVLNIVRDPYTQANVLRWIMTEGLRQALVRRKVFAKAVSKYLSGLQGKPVEVPQDALFSPIAQQHIPGLAEIYPELEKEWFSKGMEPDEIPVPEYSLGQGKVSRLSLQEINHELASRGKEPLVFGGTKGLIEYLEAGSWLPQNERYAADMMGTPWSQSHRGPDLVLGKSNPQGLKEAPDGRVYHAFGTNDGFVPSQSQRYWSTMIDQAHKESQAQLSQALQKIKAGETVEGWEELRQLEKDGLVDSKVIKQKLHTALGLSNKVASKTQWIDGQLVKTDYVKVPDNLWPKVKQAIDTAIDLAVQRPYPIDQKTAGKTNMLGTTDRAMKILISTGNPVNPEGVKRLVYDGERIYEPKPGPFDVNLIKSYLSNMWYNEDKKLVKMRLKKAVTLNGQPLISGDNLLSDSFIPMGAKYLVDAKAPLAGENRTWTPEDAEVAVDQVSFRNQPEVSRIAKAATLPADLEQLLAAGWVPTNITPEEESSLDRFGTEEGPQTRSQAIAADRTYLLLAKPGEHGVKKLTRKSPDDPWIENAPEYTEVNLEGLKQKYGDELEIQPVEGTHGRIQSVRFKNSNIRFMVKAVRGADGQLRWVMFSKGTDTGTGSPLVSDIVMKQNADMSKLTVAGGGSQEAKAKLDAFYDDFMHHPESYGDKMDYDLGAPKSVADGAKAAARIVYPNSARKAKSVLEDAVAMGYQVLHLNTDARIKWGDLDNVEVRTDLAALGLEDHIIDSVIARVRKDVSAGRETTGISPEILMTLLKNGARWRRKVVMNGVAKLLNTEKTGTSIEGDDEEEGGKPGMTAAIGDASKARHGTVMRSPTSMALSADRLERLKTSQGVTYERPGDEFDFDLFGEPKPAVAAAQPPEYYAAQAASGVSPTPKPKGRPKKVAAQAVPSGMDLLRPQTPPAAAQANLATAARGVTPNTEAPDDDGLSLLRRKAMGESANSRFRGYRQWQEMAGTGVVWGYSRKKANLRPGSGFNVWGEPGSTGTSISGEVDTVKEDPDGKKGMLKNGRLKTK